MSESLIALGHALACGLLLGLERGWTARDEASGTRVAGIRTFGLLGLTGGVAGMLPLAAGAAVMLAAGAALVIGYLRRSVRADRLSATTMLASLLALALGMLAVRGWATEALAAAAAATLLLSMRQTLHRWLQGMSETEIRSAARFGLIALIGLPLAPDRAMGPLDAWNPHQLWLVVVLVSGLSFVGYVAMRRVAPARGALVTALCGAVVSSTAVTVAFARRLAAAEEPVEPLIGGIALASSVMFGRVLLLTALLAPVALASLAMMVVPALVVVTLLGLLPLRRSAPASSADGAMKLGNPLDLTAALGLAALVAAIALATRLAFRAFGDIGIAGALALTGFADVDAAVMAFASLPPGALDSRMAGLALAGPVLLNTLLKAGIALALAPGAVGRRAALPLAVSVLAAAPGAAILL